VPPLDEVVGNERMGGIRVDGNEPLAPDNSNRLLADNEETSVTGLFADFEKHFAGGPAIRVKLHRPVSTFSLTVLFGPSGSGKSTTLRCMAGLEKTHPGSIPLRDGILFHAQPNTFLP